MIWGYHYFCKHPYWCSELSFFSGNPSWWSESHLEHIVSNRTTSTTMFQEIHFTLSLLMWATKPKHDMFWIYSFPGNSGKWRFTTISAHFQGRTCCMLISGTVTWNLKMPVSKRIFRWTMFPRNLQQDPLNGPPKPEYLIALATYLGVRW